MIAPGTRVMVKLPSHRQVVDQVEVLRLVGETAIEFQEEQFIAWFGECWEYKMNKVRGQKPKNRGEEVSGDEKQ